jgi:hypothetical protein
LRRIVVSLEAPSACWQGRYFWLPPVFTGAGCRLSRRRRERNRESAFDKGGDGWTVGGESLAAPGGVGSNAPQARRFTGSCSDRGRLPLQLWCMAHVLWAVSVFAAVVLLLSGSTVACVADKSLEICDRCRLRQQKSPAAPAVTGIISG